jgi:hypothetical protein
MRAALLSLDGSDWALPDEAEHLPGVGGRLAAGLGALLVVLEAVAVSTDDAFWVGVAALMPALFALMTIPYFLVGRRAGLSAKRTLQLLFAPPRRWGGWWPRALRRPGDVWGRLPQVVRRARRRTTMLALIDVALLPVALYALVHAARSPEPATLMGTLAACAAVALGVLGAQLVEAARLRRWAKRLGFDGRTIAKLLAERTWNSTFWRRPDVAPLLAPGVVTPRPADSLSTPALVQAIVELSEEVAAIDPAVASAAREAGLAIARAIVVLDREVTAAGRDVDPGELRRLQDRLALLEHPTESESTTKRQMRSLVERQIDLLQQLAHRYRELVGRRDALVEHMRALRLHLANLRAVSALGDAGTPRDDSIRAIIADIDYLTSAVRDVESL